MYEGLEWRDGRLWVQSTPDGEWRKAGHDRTMQHIAAQVAAAWEAGRDAARTTARSFGGPFAVERAALAIAALRPPPDLAEQLSRETKG